MFELGSAAPNYGSFFGGLRYLYILPANALLAPWQITPTGATLVKVLAPLAWLPIELDVDRWELVQNTMEEKGGKVVESTITGSFVNPTLDMIYAARALELQGVVVVCEDNEGQRWLLGNKRQPVKTLGKFTTTPTRMGTKAFSLTMSWISRFGAVPYAFDLADSSVAPGGGGSGGSGESQAGSGTPA